MKPLANLSVFAMSAIMGLASCSTDEIQEINEGEGISFTTQVSRATETTLSNLDGFYVYADANYPSMFIDGMIANKESGASNIYQLAEKVTWPVDVQKIRFWAYGPLAAKDYLTMNINATSQIAQAYNVANEIEIAGEKQNDFVVAYADVTKTPGNQVSLNFNHALAQVELKAKLGENPEEGRRVKIKGAWFVNINSTADLEFNENVNEEYHNMNWHNHKGLTAYGINLNSHIATLTSSPAFIFGNNSGKLNSLMMIPQKVGKYEFSTPAANPAAHDDIAPVAENTKGAYILLLCRIETYHPGAAQEGSENEHAIGIEGTGHIHQLYPIIKKDGKLSYDADAYGYVCVPVDIDWKPGKKYVYTLQLCGRNAGAGQYPPAVLPDGLPIDGTHINDPAADSKNPGDPVLDNEISFKVEVDNWTDAVENIDTSMK